VPSGHVRTQRPRDICPPQKYLQHSFTLRWRSLEFNSIWHSNRRCLTFTAVARCTLVKIRTTCGPFKGREHSTSSLGATKDDQPHLVRRSPEVSRSYRVSTTLVALSPLSLAALENQMQKKLPKSEEAPLA
jgi:hypothetical protein